MVTPLRAAGEAQSPTHGPSPIEPVWGNAPVGREVLWGAGVGFLSVTLLVGLLSLWNGSGRAGALGLGIYVGFFGGCGFGGMLGGIRAVTSHNGDEPAAHPEEERASAGYQQAA